MEARGAHAGRHTTDNNAVHGCELATPSPVWTPPLAN